MLWIPDLNNTYIPLGAATINVREVCVGKLVVVVVFVLKNIYYMWKYPNSY